MSDGLAITFQILAKTPNEAAARALENALASPHGQIRRRALRTLLLRRGTAGHREVLERLDRMDPMEREIVAEFAGRMCTALRRALVGENPHLRRVACRAAVEFCDYDLVPTLVNALEDPSGPNPDLLGKALLELVALLCRQLADDDSEPGLADAHRARTLVLDTLERSLARFANHNRPEVVRAFALLARRDSAVLRQILRSRSHPAHATLCQLLTTDTSNEVIRLLLSFLDDPKAPADAVATVARRSDLAFVRYLLQEIGREPSNSVKRNLKRIRTLGWLRDGYGVLDTLDSPQQHAAVRLVMLSSLARDEVFRIVSYLLKQGKPGGRRAAAEALGEYAGAEANALALTALDDPDPYVQANILAHFRRRSIPGTLPRMVEMLDSPHAVVRKAARANLDEFSFRRYLGAFDMLDDEVRRTTGELVKKVDPRTIPTLREELIAAARGRRLRGLAVAMATGLVDRVEEEIIRLSEDEDHLVRLNAATALGQTDSAASRRVLERMLNDGNHLVRQAASKSLEERDLLDQWRQSLNDPRD